MLKNPHFNQGRLITFEEKENGVVNAMLFVCIVFMLAIFAFVTLFSRGIVDGDSMLGTLHDKDSLLILKYSNNYRADDIVILTSTDGVILVKRIVAVGGDKFMFKKVYTNNNYSQKIVLLVSDSSGELVEIDESYIFEDMKVNSVSWQNHRHFEFDKEYTVPQNQYLYLGDNRNDSKDSRYYGFSEKSAIIGKSVYTVRQNTLLMTVLNIFFPEPKK